MKEGDFAHTTTMPAIYTHYLVSRETLKILPDEIALKIRPHLSLYYYGCYGPDFCFFYKPLRKKENLGSFLHKRGGFTSFQVLKAFSQTPALLAYSLGYITHYAADVCFHPFVYQETKSLLEHSKLENAIDGYLKEEGKPKDFPPALSQAEKQELFVAYAAITAKCDLPPLEKTAFFRAISLFNAYLPMPNALLWGKTPVKKAVVDGLFLRSVTLSKELCEKFLQPSPLTVTDFGKNYLTGLTE